MKLVYFKSAICPRCIPTNRLIAQLRKEYPEIEIEQVEVLTHFARARHEGVRTLPTLIAGKTRFYAAPRMEELVAALQAEEKAAANSRRVCSELKVHLSEYLDGEMGRALCDELDAHLRECPDCRVVVDTTRQTLLLYHALEREPMPADARTRLYRALALPELTQNPAQGNP